LLGLPQPAGMKHMGQNRKKGATQLSQHTKHIVDKLIACAERAACPPSTLYSMFKCYDTDGSGCIAYDEMREMVRETECNIEGADMAALLLKHLSGGKGELAYNEFIQKVVGLPEGALRPEGNSTTRLCTAEATQKLAAGVKGTLYASPRAVHRVFSIFDDDNSGSIRASEFVQGLAKLRLPIRPNQAKAMFHELADTKGVLTQADFAARVLHAEGPEDRVARQFGSTVEKLSSVLGPSMAHTRALLPPSREPPPPSRALTRLSQSSSSFGTPLSSTMTPASAWLDLIGAREGSAGHTQACGPYLNWA